MTEQPTRMQWNRWVNLVRKRTSTPSDVEDLVQEAYIRLFQTSKNTIVENPDGFVLRAASNLAISAHRTRHRHGKALSDSAVIALLRADATTQDEVLEDRERLKIMEEALMQLPIRTREIFVLHRIDGMRYREVALAFGISVSAVEKHMSRAIAHLAIIVSELKSK